MIKFLMMMTMTSTMALMCREEDKDPAGGGGGGDDKSKSMLDVDAIKALKTQDPAPETKTAEQLAAEEAEKNKTADLPGQKQVRPDWLKEDKFWDAEKGEVKAEDILKSYKELEAKFHKGDHKAPAKAEDYKLNLSDEQKTVLFGDAKADPAADPYIKGFTAWGVKNGVSQDGLNELLGMYHDLVAPEVSKAKIDIEVEKKALGPNADAVIKNQFDFLGQLYKAGHINDAMLNESQILMETSAGVKLLQAIRSYYGEAPIPTNITAQDGMPTKEELSAMLNDPKYDTDPDHKAKVDALYAKRYGNAPAMSSAQNR
jgi:hypothetical protein